MLDRIRQDLTNMHVFVPEDKRNKFIKEVTQRLNGSGIILDEQLLNKFRSDGVVYKALRVQLMGLTSEHREALLRVFCEVKKLKSAKEKPLYRISEDQRGFFINDFEKLMGWDKKEGLLYKNAGFESIENFRKTGILPPEWMPFFQKKKGGMEILGRYIPELAPAKETPNEDSKDDLLNSELFVSENRRDEFFTQLKKLMDDCGSDDEFEERLGLELVDNFKDTGEVDNSWKTIFSSIEGALELLSEFSSNQEEDIESKMSSEADSSKNNEGTAGNPDSSISDSSEEIYVRAKGRRPESELVPKGNNAKILENIKELCSIKTDNYVASELGIHFTAISGIKREIGRWHLADLVHFSKKFNVPVDSFYEGTSMKMSQEDVDIAPPRIQEEVNGQLSEDGAPRDSSENVEARESTIEPSGAKKVSRIDLIPPDIKKALSDALSSALDRRVFLGVLMEKLQGCDLRFNKKDMLLIVKKEGEGRFEISLNDYPF